MKCVLVLGLTILFITLGEALKCYVCDSDQDASCGTATPAANLLMDCETVLPGADICTASLDKKNGKECAKRNCSSIVNGLQGGSMDVCVSAPDGHKVCQCFSDGCNINPPKPKD